MTKRKPIINRLIIRYGQVINTKGADLNLQFPVKGFVLSNCWGIIDYYKLGFFRFKPFNRFRTCLLYTSPVFEIDRRAFQTKLTFPESIAKNMVRGKLTFYRANTTRYDKEFEIELDANGEFAIDISEFPVGAWKVKIDWSDEEKEYYREIAFVI